MKNSSRMPPDHAERCRIEQDLSTCLLVEAAAGTGKTTSLVGRMIALLREGVCDIEHLAAVTFTRKAAAELRARFQLELERTAQVADDPGQARLADALSKLNRCYVGTIHSFCAKLLRERPIEAGVDLAFRELEDAEDDLLRASAWSEFVAELFAADDGALLELTEVGLKIAQLRQTFLAFADYPDVDAWPCAEVDLGDLGGATKELKSYLAHMATLAPTFPPDRGTDTLMTAYERLLRLARHRNLDRPAEVLELLEACKPNQKATQKCWLGGAKQGKAESVRWAEFATSVAQPLVERWRQKRYTLVIRILQRAVAAYDRVRARGGCLNYQDLLLQAARLLRDKPAVRRYFRDRFTHLLVDEFQDTDPVQAQIMLLLTASDPDEQNWRKCRPAPGSLFVVGDPKQSIYRFRRADIVTYNQVKEIILASDGDVLSLTTNFRTRGEIVDWNNAIFAASFPAVADRFSPAACAMQIGREEGAAGELNQIRVLSIPEEHCGKDNAVEYESDFIARYIRQCLDAKRTVSRTSKELALGVSPQVTPGDFLIVTWNTKHLVLYGRKLQELGVPCQVSGGSSLAEVTELRLLAQCLRTLTEPENPVALVSILRGELFGFSDADLYAFRQAGGAFMFRSRLPEGLEAPVAAQFLAAWVRLQQYALWLTRLPVVAAVERIAADLGLLQRALLGPSGNVRAGSLAKVFQLLRAAHADMHAIADVAVFFEDLLAQSGNQDVAAARPQVDSSVRLMNLHKVKGLEAPVVFLASPVGKWNPPINLHVDRAGDQVLGFLAVHEESSGFHPKLLACPVGWDSCVTEEKQFAAAERTRLLYVAATRVGSHLIVCRKDKDNGKTNYWDFFADHLQEFETLQDPGLPQAPQRKTVRITAADLQAAELSVNSRWTCSRAATYATAAAKDSSLSPSALHRPVTSEAHGTEWGTVIHFLLQQAMVAPESDLRPLAYTALEEQGLSTSLVEEALATVRSVTESVIWRRARSASRFFVEVPFTRLLEPGAEGATLPTILRGVIDLAFEEPDGWVIVDYKTDAVTSEHLGQLVDHYRPQVDTYSRQWEQIVGQPVKERGLYFVRFGIYQPV